MRASRGFTLIGLLVVLVVLGVIAALLLPALAGERECARRVQCTSNLKQFGLAMHMYAQDFGEFPPHDVPDEYAVGDIEDFPSTVGYNAEGKPPLALEAGDGLAALHLLYTEGYITDPQIYRCPSDRDVKDDPGGARGVAAAGCTAGNTSYGYDPRHKTTHPAGTAVMADRADTSDPRKCSPNHAGYRAHGGTGGINVLYIDGHVTWFSRTAVGYGSNEIFDPADDAAVPEAASHIIQ